MLSWLNKKKSAVESDLRDTLFGDLPLSVLTKQNHADATEPWSLFEKADKSLETNDEPKAIEALISITKTPGFESRIYLQAWHFLRKLGVTPPHDLVRKVYGTIVEVMLEQGPDVVAAYADHSARYLNFSGSAIIWDNPDDSMSQQIDGILSAGKHIINNIEPWNGKRPSSPSRGFSRINILTPGGIYIIQDSFDDLVKNEMSNAVITAAAGIIHDLMGKSAEKHKY